MTRVLILGATGRTGRHVVTEALRSGYELTVFVRDPSKLPIDRSRIRVQLGHLPDDVPALASALADHEAVISTLGAGNSRRSGGLMADGVPAIIRAMRTAGLQRLILMSAYG